MIQIQNETYYTTKEVSEKFNVTMKCVNDWRDKGWLKFKKLGPKKLIYSETDLKNFMENKHD